MMKIAKRVATLAAAALTFVACDNGVEEGSPEVNVGGTDKITFTVGDDGSEEARSVLSLSDGATALWNGTEEAGFFYSYRLSGASKDTKVSGAQNIIYTATATPASASATFGGDAEWYDGEGTESAAHKFYFYYPYREGSESHTKVKGTLPAEQNYDATAEVWDMSAYDFVYANKNDIAYGSQVALNKLRRAFAVLRLEITNASGEDVVVSKVTLTSKGGRILAGDFLANISKGTVDQGLSNHTEANGTNYGYWTSTSSEVATNVANGTLKAGEKMNVRLMLNAGYAPKASSPYYDSTTAYLEGDTFSVVVESDKGTHPVVEFKAGGLMRGGSAVKKINLKGNSIASRYPAVTGQPCALVPDGVSDTYAYMNAHGYYEECPDESGSHAESPVRHITQVWDTTLARYVYRFDIHIAIDDDRGKADVTDRQRNEIKTYEKSPENMVAAEDETHTYTWKFQIPKGFKATSRFCHLHQLKGYGGDDVGNPLMTLVARLVNGEQYLELTHYGPNGASAVKLQTALLSDFEGEWVMATETATYSHSGAYEIEIVRLRDDKVLLSYQTDNIDIWRDGADAIRPKWGIYRYVGENGSMRTDGSLRDESLLFTDFTIEEK